jgi:hypothetical protein
MELLAAAGLFVGLALLAAIPLVVLLHSQSLRSESSNTVSGRHEEGKG